MREKRTVVDPTRQKSTKITLLVDGFCCQRSGVSAGSGSERVGANDRLIQCPAPRRSTDDSVTRMRGKSLNLV